MGKNVLKVLLLTALVLLIGSLSLCVLKVGNPDDESTSDNITSSMDIPGEIVDVGRVTLDKKALYF